MVIKFVGIVLLALLVTALFMVIYFKTLSVIAKWIDNRYGNSIRQSYVGKKFFPNIGNKGSNPRQESKIVIGCIDCFDKTYDFFKSNKRRLSKLVHRIIGIRDICEDNRDHNKESENEYLTANIKSFLQHHLTSLCLVGSSILLLGWAIFVLLVSPINVAQLNLGFIVVGILSSLGYAIGLLSLLFDLTQNHPYKHQNKTNYQEENSSCSVSKPISFVNVICHIVQPKKTKHHNANAKDNEKKPHPTHTGNVAQDNNGVNQNGTLP